MSLFINGYRRKLKEMIVYKVTNLINQKIYIGQTIHSLEKRKKQHEKAAYYKNCRGIFDLAIKKIWERKFQVGNY